ncbi:unnamed protein product [Amoebophrya sp. A120]|nr:unnamed protein product [Amoebophrya sp. A120]|eukprot:GSA120T00001731001.1
MSVSGSARCTLGQSLSNDISRRLHSVLFFWGAPCFRANLLAEGFNNLTCDCTSSFVCDAV